MNREEEAEDTEEEDEEDEEEEEVGRVGCGGGGGGEEGEEEEAVLGQGLPRPARLWGLEEVEEGGAAAVPSPPPVQGV